MRHAVSVLLTVVLVVFAAAAGFAAEPAPGPETVPSTDPEAPAELPGGISVREGCDLVITATEDGSYEIRGLVAAPAAQAVRAPEFIGMFDMPDGIEGRVQRGDIVLSSKEIAATGDIACFTLGDIEVAQATIIVAGDVIGSGIMSLAQLVRLAGAVSGSGPALEGPYLAAADLDGSGVLSLSDLVRESELLKKAMPDSRNAA